MYTIGQKVCLWGVHRIPGRIVVLKEVIVTITDIKTGVLGEFSRQPVSAQSLRGTAEDGTVYEKHWERWPESQTNDFIGQWSRRDDGDESWIPFEATAIYDDFSRTNKTLSGDNMVKITDESGVEIRPKGDIVHCKRHDRYSHPGTECFFCTYGVRPD